MVRSLARGLSAEEYTVDVALDGQEGLSRALSEGYDAIILDLMLPRLNGYAVTAALRDSGVRTPVLMLTAKQGEFDQTEALDTGADDFLSKPFSYPVLLARLRALIRRGGSSQGAVLAYGDIRLDTREHRCWRDGEQVSLTGREFALLAYLLHRKRRTGVKGRVAPARLGSLRRAGCQRGGGVHRLSAPQARPARRAFPHRHRPERRVPPGRESPHPVGLVGDDPGPSSTCSRGSGSG